MTYCSRRRRHCRQISLALGVVWLPYIAVRCVGNPANHGDCGMLHPATQAHAENAHVHGHHHETPSPVSHDHNHSRGPGSGPSHTCCDLTGKCNVTITSVVPSLNAADTISMVSLIVQPIALLPQYSHRSPVRGVAHAPPTYLRNLTLRI